MNAANPFEIGIFSFGELTRNTEGKSINAATRMRDILEWARNMWIPAWARCSVVAELY